MVNVVYSSGVMHMRERDGDCRPFMVALTETGLARVDFGPEVEALPGRIRIGTGTPGSIVDLVATEEPGVYRWEMG